MQRIDTISEQATAYELVYQHDRREFCKRDPETMAKNAGLKLRNGQITVPYYHTVLAVNAENGEVTYEADPTKPVPVYPRMMTLHHLNGVKDGAQNSGILIPFRKIRLPFHGFGALCPGIQRSLKGLCPRRRTAPYNTSQHGRPCRDLPMFSKNRSHLCFLGRRR